MISKTRWIVAALAAVVVCAGTVRAGDPRATLTAGTPDIKSVGPVAFAPEGILLIGDAKGAAIFAIDTNDRTAAGTGAVKIEGINEKIAGMVGTNAKGIQINDMAVNPLSGNVYLTVTRGQGDAAQPIIIRVNREGKIEDFSLKNVKFAKAALPNPSEKNRADAITDIAYVDGRVFVAGLSNEEFSSRLRAIPFPFSEVDKGASVEIYHGSHGKFETASPIRTFVPYKIEGQSYLLAAYTCTPLVKIPVSSLKPGEHVKGTTIAELGNHNRPLDMIVYQKGGKDYILMANNSRGLMKITTENIGKIEGITQRISDKAGLTYETIENMKGVQHLDLLDKEHALVLIKTDTGAMNLETIALP